MECGMHNHEHMPVWKIETEIVDASRDAGTVRVTHELPRNKLKLE
jgi:hypothetical protein